MTAIDSLKSAPRDCRLDFVRGLALLIIFVNHIPGNEGQFFTLSRYGWSDAAEIFVFCSGYVSALVFGRGFERSGLWLGTVRVLQRCSQIYVVHLGLFIALALSCLIGNTLFPGHDYIAQLNIHFFFDQTQAALPAMVTLNYLPNSIDILPMYLVLLAWTPVFWTLGKVHHRLAWLASIGLYLATWAFDLDLSAQPDSDRGWFFNPFAWQLIFFAGYSLGAGWIRVRLGQPAWLLACLVLVILVVPFAHESALRPLAWMRDLYSLIDPLYEKTRLGPLRLIHFAALAYLAATLFQRHPGWMEKPAAIKVRAMGQHSLAVFAVGLLLSWICGMVLDQAGHGLMPLLIVNFGGMALLLATGQLLDWLQGKPWKQVRGRVAGATRAAAIPRITLADVRDWVLRPLGYALLLLPLASVPFLMPRKMPLQLASAQPDMLININDDDSSPILPVQGLDSLADPEGLLQTDFDTPPLAP